MANHSRFLISCARAGTVATCIQLVLLSLPVAALTPPPDLRPPPRAQWAHPDVECQHPHYPKQSQQREQVGKVTLAFYVDTNGKVLDRKLLRSSGHPLLDQAAMEGFSQCRFTPASYDGIPARAWAIVRYTYTLE